MKPNGLQASLNCRIADLRSAYPRITVCHAALQTVRDGARVRHSLWLDLRWPEHQSIVSGPVRESVEDALQAGFDKARAILDSSQGPEAPPTTPPRPNRQT